MLMSRVYEQEMISIFYNKNNKLEYLPKFTGKSFYFFIKKYPNYRKHNILCLHTPKLSPFITHEIHSFCCTGPLEIGLSTPNSGSRISRNLVRISGILVIAKPLK